MLFPAHTITVEPLNRDLRKRTNLRTDPNHLAVVERVGGNLIKVCTTSADIHAAYDIARGVANTYGATVVTRSSYAPTVVGADNAAELAHDPDCQPFN